jgi:NADH-ubiquinone oxidoreductase chain 5
MYLAIITLPLLGSIVSGFFGRKVGVSGAQLITCTSVIVTTLLAIVAFFEVGLNNIPVSINLFRWIDSESLNVLWGFHFDSLTVSMLIPVLIVSSLVHIYSIGYMSHDPHNQRFFSYLSLFTFMMIILVTANNFLLMFVGWEGVGICSYLLVSFWFTRIAANQSSMSAFLTNRVGDCFLTIGMFAILWSFGNIDYSTVFSLAPFVNENIVTIIGICLLIGAMAKSSQVGLHVWLPMAMEGPTPVSALIHAATMVTAGVYLLMRTSPLIEYSSTVLILCLWLGAITTVFSSLIGLFQQDIKKVIAYSTMSQLGMMVIAVGLSSYNVALFHLVNHAFYKGLLFLGAGAVIHAVADNQDFRKYGGLRPFLPLTYSVMLIASLSLVAFPFMTGFYSKDFILESAYGQFYFSGTVVYFIATIGAMFTTLYSVKVLYLTFLTNPNGPIVNYKHAHEGDIFMSLPLIILAIFSIFFGYITKDIFIGLGSGFFADNSIFIHPTHEIMLDTEFAVPTLFKLLPLVFTISLSILAIIFSEFIPKVLISFKLSRLGYNIFGFFNQRFLIELFYNKYITGLVLKLGGQTTKILDKGSVELLGPFGLEKGLITLSRNIASLDKGVITSYALYILIGLIFYMLIPYLALTDNSLLLLILIALLSVITTNLKDNSSDTVVSVGESKHENTFSPLESKLFFDFFKSISYYIHSNRYVRDYSTKSINDTPEGIKNEVNNFSEEANVKPFNIFNTQDLNDLNEHTSLKMNVGLPKADLIQLRAGDLFVVLSSLDKFRNDRHSSIVSKLFFVKDNHKFLLDDMRSNLNILGVKLTYVFYIGDFEQKSNTLNPTSSVYEDELVVFMHFKYAEWLPFVSSNQYNFIRNNNHCLYIIKNGTFTDVKKLFQYLNWKPVNVGRGSTQKSHITSDLDIKMHTYLLSIYNLNVNSIRYNNDFSNVNKSVYLTYEDWSNPKFIIRNLDSSTEPIRFDKNPRQDLVDKYSDIKKR